MTSVQHAVLEALDSARNYNAWIASLTRPYLGDDPIEIGSGTGTFAAAWLEAGVAELTVSEVDKGPDRRSSSCASPMTLGSPFRPLDVLEAVEATAPSSAVALNVLEHISARRPRSCVRERLGWFGRPARSSSSCRPFPSR